MATKTALPKSLSIEMDLGNIEGKKPGFAACQWGRVKAKVVETAKTAKKVGKDDPRRIVHSMKVGLALTLVSLFYYFRPLYEGFGEAGMWAILTVVVVFEFTVGGTLSRSLNRGAATLIAAALGLGAEYLAGLGGDKGDPIIVAIMVFILATVSTFMRFFPNVRSRYDYGMMMFILTFTLVAVSSFRVSEIIQLARHRLATILIGGAMCILVSVSIYPVWAGQDLHNLVADNLEKLAAFLDGFGGEFFSSAGDGGKCSDKTSLVVYKSVLNSKGIEESLANFAWWEPRHGSFRFGHPWKQYLTIGVLARECARHIETLEQYLMSTPKVGSELSMEMQEPLTRMSRESGKALKEVSSSLKNMRILSPAVETHVQNSKAAAADLRNVLQNFSLRGNDLKETMRLFVASSTLTDIIKCVDKIVMSIDQLSQQARFRKAISTQETVVEQGNDAQGKDCTVNIRES